MQPNGPKFEDKQVKYKDVTLTPVQPAGFGCPCHGGAYDTEGNRTAGPPVRSLDRYAFSIVNGNLVLGKHFSVGTVDGNGRRGEDHAATGRPIRASTSTASSAGSIRIPVPGS